MKTKITSYNLQQYLAEREKEQIQNQNDPLAQSDYSVKTPNSQYGWITLTSEIDRSARYDGSFDVYGFYSWLKEPVFCGTDFIGLSHFKCHIWWSIRK